MHTVSLRKQFFHGLRWNSLESVIYYTIFASHQLLLRTITDTLLYGTIGTLFALIYLLIIVTNFGFDLSLVPFFAYYKANKYSFKSYFVKQLIVQGGIYSLAAMIFMFVLMHGLLPIKNIIPLNLSLSFIIGSLIFTEGIKKSLRITLQLAFLTHITALIELFYIISYVTIFWTIYIIYGTVSLYVIFVPMLLLSCLSTAFLACATYQFYKALPILSENSQQSVSLSRIIKNRMINYGYQLSKTIFTSNFLIPFFAITYGLSMAALLELVTSINQFVTIILQKIMGITGQTLLSNVKNMTLKNKQAAFEVASQNLYPLLYILFAVILIAYKPLIFIALPYKTTSSTIGIIFFMLLFSENFLILYEKLFIMEEKTNYLIALNGIILNFFYALTQIPRIFSPLFILFILLCIRWSTFVLFCLLAFSFWNIKPPFRQDKPMYLAGTVFFLFVFYFFVTYLSPSSTAL